MDLQIVGLWFLNKYFRCYLRVDTVNPVLTMIDVDLYILDV